MDRNRGGSDKRMELDHDMIDPSENKDMMVKQAPQRYSTRSGLFSF